MRHGKKFNHLSRQASHRKAMLANMACSLIEHKRINTTVAKAKALQKFIEPIITKSKDDTTHSRRIVFNYLREKSAVNELFREVSVKVAERHGGYTRILKTGFRLGDNAQMCFIELVDYNENMLKETKKKKSRSRRGRAKKKSTEGTANSVEQNVETTTTETKAKVTDEPVADEKVKAKNIENTNDALADVKKEVESEPKADAPADDEKKNEPEAKKENTPKSDVKEDEKNEDKPDSEKE